MGMRIAAIEASNRLDVFAVSPVLGKAETATLGDLAQIIIAGLASAQTLYALTALEISVAFT